MTMAELGKDVKALAVQEIMSFCEVKGTTVFLPHLLKLLDIEYLRSWTGLKHVKFPTDCTDDKIPNKHWRYRFYHGVAAVLGWTEHITHGDSKYFGEKLHRAIKDLWPDEQPAGETSKVRPKGKHQSHVQPSFSCTVSEFILPGQDSEVVTCRVETSTHLSVHSRPAGEEEARKRQRLPSWIKKGEFHVVQDSSDTSSSASASDNGCSQ